MKLLRSMQQVRSIFDERCSKRKVPLHSAFVTAITTNIALPSSPSTYLSVSFHTTAKMAPVTLNTVDTELKDIIQHLFEIQSAVHGYLGPETQQELVRKIKNLTVALSTLSNDTRENNQQQQQQSDQNASSKDPPVSTIQLPPEIIDYVDAARNPDIYTREFVELVQRGNQDLKGKQEAFRGFRDVLAREMRSAMPECRGEVDRVITATGGETQ
ncbi:transcription factor subunit Med10 of mediator complex-domain-containing protein [Aspergillus taichungensis]|uniref:Mediator of RNA polymerase II transcription subunit 10 n=1 Tax=Aspergillus taichungensis TaxID=482145 RepID=A0A2J5HU55_9EURO|nr:transcription factor subunit Med10 of mediator complex-domain-containing protein [Aspergillus taichungensis]